MSVHVGSMDEAPLLHFATQLVARSCSVRRILHPLRECLRKRRILSNLEELRIMEHEGVTTIPHVLGPLAVRPPHIAASKCAGEGGPKNRLEIGNPLPAARNMSFETIGQGEDGSSHFVVAGIAYPLLTRKEWKKRRHHGCGRRRRCGAHEITVLLEL
jgi:hypothetical protein